MDLPLKEKHYRVTKGETEVLKKVAKRGHGTGHGTLAVRLERLLISLSIRLLQAKEPCPEPCPPFARDTQIQKYSTAVLVRVTIHNCWSKNLLA